MRGSVVEQAQLAHYVTWLDPNDDGEMVQQSVANWIAAGTSKHVDHYGMNGSQHGQGVNYDFHCGHDGDCHHDTTMGVDTKVLVNKLE